MGVVLYLGCNMSMQVPCCKLASRRESANIVQRTSLPMPDLREMGSECLLLGVTPELGQALKLGPALVFNVIRAIGNYGELYERTMGGATPMALPRGPNNLWTNGGLIYALPMR